MKPLRRQIVEHLRQLAQIEPVLPFHPFFHHPLSIAGAFRRLVNQIEIEKALAVVLGTPEQLPARNILEGCGNAPRHKHVGGFCRIAVVKARQRRAMRTKQKYGFFYASARLFDRKRRQLLIIKARFRHDLIDQRSHRCLNVFHIEDATVLNPFVSGS